MIISNATPLIAFSRIGRLDLLRETVGEPLVIPAAVATEISEYESSGPGSIDLARETWIRTRSVADEQQVRLLLPTLDRGEAEVIALGLEEQARLLLIDELIGRKVAESLGLGITGSAGILIRAKQLGEIEAIKPLLEHMVREGMYFSQRFLEAVLRQVRVGGHPPRGAPGLGCGGAPGLGCGLGWAGLWAGLGWAGLSATHFGRLCRSTASVDLLPA